MPKDIKVTVSYETSLVPVDSHGSSYRYDSIDMYISASDKLKPEYNDNKSEVHEPTLAKLLQSGVDETLARHISHLFIRDPLVIFGYVILCEKPRGYADSVN